MLIGFLPLVVLAIAAFRLTRLAIIDTILQGPRTRFHVFLGNRQGKLQGFWEKIYELTSCTWCFGFWVSLALYSFFLWTSPFNLNRMDWISVFAIAGAQGFLHALEPQDG